MRNLFQDLDGNLITADSEESLAAKIRSLLLAAIASSAIALASCFSNKEHRKPIPPLGSEVSQVAGYICPSEEDQNKSAHPMTGPSDPPNSADTLGILMDNNGKSPKKCKEMAESRKILASLRFVAKTAAPRVQLTENSASQGKLAETDPRSPREGRL